MMKKQWMKMIAVAGMFLAAQQTRAATFDVTTADGMVINGVNALVIPDVLDLTDTVNKNGNFSPTAPGANAQFAFMTLDTATLNSILETQLGALGAGQSYQINSATYILGIDDGTPQSGYQSNGGITVHAVKSTSAFNVDQATWNNRATGTSWASGSVSAADWGATVITTGVDNTAYSTTFDLTDSLQRWVDGEANYGLAFVQGGPSGEGALSWVNSGNTVLTINAGIIEDEPPVVITPPQGQEILVDDFSSGFIDKSGNYMAPSSLDDGWHASTYDVYPSAWNIVGGVLKNSANGENADFWDEFAAEGSVVQGVSVGDASGKRLSLSFDYSLAAAGESLSLFLFGSQTEAGFLDSAQAYDRIGSLFQPNGQYVYLEADGVADFVSSTEFATGETIVTVDNRGTGMGEGTDYPAFATISGETSGTFSQTVDLTQWGFAGIEDFDYITVVFARNGAATGSEVIIDNLSLVASYITWDNDSEDGLWTTASNWNPDFVPGSSDRVLVGTGGAVINASNAFGELYVEEDASVTFSGDLLQAGNMISSAGTLDKSGTWRLNGAEVTLESTGVLGANITHFDMLNGTLNVEDGASFANSSMPFEHKGANTFGYTLSENGFTTMVVGPLYASGVDWSDATYNIDVSEYDISHGTSIVLADYTSHVAAFDGPFDPTVNIITGTGTQELGGSLSFDTTESQLILTVTDFVNDAPVARNLSFSIPADDAVSFTLPASDPDGQALSYAIVDGPANGTLSGTAPNLTYTAPGGWAGSDEITFTASDGALTSNTGTVSVASMPQTAAAVWSLYDDAIRNDPLNVEWLTSWTNGNIVVSQIRYDLGTMVGTRTTASPKMAAFYAYPIGGTDLPGIVQIHGGGQKGDAALAQYWAEQGYAAISINWGTGDLLAGYPNTDWDGLPAGQYHPGTDFRNWTDPHATATHASLYDVSHPLNSSWMLNSYAARRALTFLQGESYVDGSKLGVTGHSMGGTSTVITSTDPRITCVTPSVGGPGYRYQDWWGVPGSGRTTHDTAYLTDYNNTVASEVYWADITCPTLYLEASNDFNAPFDPVVQSMALQLSENPGVPQQLAFSPHKNHIFDTDAYAARVLWQKAHLTDGFDFPERPVAQLDLMQEDGVPLFRVWPDESTSNSVVSVDIYYGVDRQVLSRFYRDAQAVETNGHWEAKCPVFDLDEMLVALAVVTYDCGFDLAMPAGYTSPTRTFSVASEVSLVYPPELENSGVVATAEKVRLTDDFSRGYHDWYWRWAGLSNWQCTTRKVTDPSWKGPAGADLALDVVTTTAGNTLGIKLNTLAWHEGSANTYTASVALPVAGTNSITVSLSDFTNGQGSPLTTWDNATWLQLSSASGYPTWTGAMPEFDNLRWVGGEYTFINGITSTWLEQYDLPLNDRAVLDDSDGDGLSAWQEEFAGTNPTNSASVLRVSEAVPVSNGLSVSWQAVEGKSYSVWFKAKLTDAEWIEKGTGIPGAEPFCSHTVLTDSATGFVRIEVE